MRNKIPTGYSLNAADLTRGDSYAGFVAIALLPELILFDSVLKIQIQHFQKVKKKKKEKNKNNKSGIIAEYKSTILTMHFS